MEDFSNETKVTILLSLLDKQYQELSFRRQREFYIFLWTATLYLAIISLVLTSNVFAKASVWGRVLACVISVFIGWFSISWQNRQKKFGNLNSRMMVRIQSLLGAYQPGLYDTNTLYPQKWQDWGNKASYFHWKRYFRGNYVTATWVLAAASILSYFIA
jgi:hypothetical protein